MQPRGAHGFGYDPLFYYEPFGCTFGEASDEQKMQVSHRAQALRSDVRFLARAIAAEANHRLRVQDFPGFNPLTKLAGSEPAGLDALVFHRATIRLR